ncbi:MAG: hypothetical protein NTV92_06910 [Candidatus Bipolaricaulota bacterium]|nr:hypothetical protein [Candidatus Bipolaricaulota bacterium]
MERQKPERVENGADEQVLTAQLGERDRIVLEASQSESFERVERLGLAEQVVDRRARREGIGDRRGRQGHAHRLHAQEKVEALAG